MIKFVVKSARPWSVAGHVKGVDINRTLPMTYIKAKEHLDMITAPRDPFYEALRYSFHWIEPCPPEPAPRRLEWEDVMGKAPDEYHYGDESPECLDDYLDGVFPEYDQDHSPCPMDPIARTQEYVSRLVESGHVSQEADMGWIQYMADMYPEYDQDYMERDSVDVVASGYEFMCHECGALTKIIEWSELVQCESCCCTFRANVPEHVYE